MDLKHLNRKYPEKRAIITGANSGVGHEILKLLLANEWTVLALDINTSYLANMENKKLLHIEQLDITDRVAFEKAIAHFTALNNGLDILFNHAGVGEGVRFKDYSLDNWDWIIDINLKSVIAGCHFAFGIMQKQSRGLIVNMASAAGYANLPNMSPYNVTKAGVISLSESLSHEFSPYGIQVLCVTPTFFQSNIMSRSKGTSDVLESANGVVNTAKLNSSDAARIILSRLHKKKEHLRFPFSSKAIFLSKKYLSRLYTKAVRKYLVK